MGRKKYTDLDELLSRARESALTSLAAAVDIENRLWTVRSACGLVQPPVPVPGPPPSEADRPYLKGPDSTPLLGGDKVTVVSAAPPEQNTQRATRSADTG